MAILTAISGKVGDVQAKVNAAAAGDTVVIPTGDWHTDTDYIWHTPLVIDRGSFNIKLIGGSATSPTIAGRPKITGDAGMASLLNIVCYDSTPRYTMEIGYLDFENDSRMFNVDGITTITSSGSPPVYTGGFRMHHCKMAYPWYIGTGFTLTNNVTYTSGATQISSSGYTFTAADVGRVLYGQSSLPIHVSITAGNGSTANISKATTGALTNGTVSFTGITSGIGSLSSGAARNDGGYNHVFYDLTGWIMGVMDHCEWNVNLLRFVTKAGEINTYCSPTDLNDLYGDYAYSLGPLQGRPELGANLVGFYFEDNIFHYGSKALTDCGAANHGGAIIISRHNTRWGSIAVHGTRETGGRQHGGRLMETYNDHYVRYAEYRQTSTDTFPHETRDGEQIFYNNFISSQLPRVGTNSIKDQGGVRACYLTSYTHVGNTYYWGPPDGLCPMDVNRKDVFTDSRTGFTHTPYAGYSPPAVSNATIYGGTDSIAAGKDTSNPFGGGQTFGDVYGLATGGPSGSLPGATVTCQITGTNIVTGGVIPANYFRWAAIRNPAQRRDAFGCMSRIMGHPASGAGPPYTVTLTVETLNIAGGNQGNGLIWNPSGMEIRFPFKYFGAPGQGSLPDRILRNSVPVALQSGNPIKWQDSVSGGIWQWGNRRRFGNVLPFEAEDITSQAGNIIPDGKSSMVIQDYHYYNGGLATDIFKGAALPAAQEFQPLFNRGYPWKVTGSDVVAGASNPATRVGADWGKDFVDPQTGQIVASTVGVASPRDDGTITGNTVTPEFASFYMNGVGGLVYPHPLVEAPAAPADTLPVITTTETGNEYVAGVAEDFTVSATGSPTPVFSVSGSPALPTGVTLVLSSPADGTAIIRAGTGTGVGTTTVHLRATNSVGFDSQDFTVTIVASTSVTLTKPVDGTSFNQPAIIDLSATVTTNSTISKVEFIRGTSPNEVIVATVTTPSITGTYDGTWSSMADNTYTLKARAYDTSGNVDSTNTSTITVQTVTAPLDPPTIVVTG